MRNNKSKLRSILALGLFISIATVPFSGRAQWCWDVTTTPGTDVACNACYETGSPIPHMATCGGPSYKIDTYTSCQDSGSSWWTCVQTNCVVGRLYTCVATPNQPQIDYCDNKAGPGCLLICIGCFTTGFPIPCAGCALCLNSMAGDCVGCAIVICARSPDYTPINGHNANPSDPCAG